MHDLDAKERVVIGLLCANAVLRTNNLKLFDRDVETLKVLWHSRISKYLGFLCCVRRLACVDNRSES